MDIHALQEWSDKWLLCFHPEKCKAMGIGKSRIEQMDYSLKDGLPPMEYVESEKDIGVVIDNKLTFNQHISEKINKANSIMGVLRRTIYGIHGLYNIQTIIYSVSKATFRICQPRPDTT